MKHPVNKGSVWRDAKGRITVPGSLCAVTATTRAGKTWDVKSEPFKLLKRK